MYLVFIASASPTADMALNVAGGSGRGTGGARGEQENIGPHNNSSSSGSGSGTGAGLQGLSGLGAYGRAALRTSFATENEASKRLIENYDLVKKYWTADVIEFFVDAALKRWGTDLKRPENESTRDWTFRVVNFLSQDMGYSKTMKTALQNFVHGSSHSRKKSKHEWRKRVREGSRVN